MSIPKDIFKKEVKKLLVMLTEGKGYKICLTSNPSEILFVLYEGDKIHSEIRFVSGEMYDIDKLTDIITGV